MIDYTEYLKQEIGAKGHALKCDGTPMVSLFRICRQIMEDSNGIVRLGIQTGDVKVNGKVVKDDHYECKPGDVIETSEGTTVTLDNSIIIGLW